MLFHNLDSPSLNSVIRLTVKKLMLRDSQVTIDSAGGKEKNLLFGESPSFPMIRHSVQGTPLFCI